MVGLADRQGRDLEEHAARRATIDGEGHRRRRSMGAVGHDHYGDRKTGREVDTIFPYNFYEGMFYVRQELIDNVPDVVQAISDAFMEATLWIRLNPDKAADFLAEEPTLKVFRKAAAASANSALQQSLQADLQLSVRKAVGRGERPNREMAEGSQPRHQGADRQGLRRLL